MLRACRTASIPAHSSVIPSQAVTLDNSLFISHLLGSSLALTKCPHDIQRSRMEMADEVAVVGLLNPASRKLYSGWG